MNRSSVRFRQAAHRGIHTSPVSRFTYGSDFWPRPALCGRGWFVFGFGFGLGVRDVDGRGWAVVGGLRACRRLAGCGFGVAGGCSGGGYGGAARLAGVTWRRRLRVLGGWPRAARLVLSACRFCQVVRMRWLRTVSRHAVRRVSGTRPIWRHQPRAMVVVAGSLMVAKARSALVRRV
jgi:hypothetical protein